MSKNPQTRYLIQDVFGHVLTGEGGMIDEMFYGVPLTKYKATILLKRLSKEFPGIKPHLVQVTPVASTDAPKEEKPTRKKDVKDTKTASYMMKSLASELRALGWQASITDANQLQIVEDPFISSPRFSVAKGRYLWRGYWAARPKTMARRLDTQLRKRRVTPSTQPYWSF